MSRPFDYLPDPEPCDVLQAVPKLPKKTYVPIGCLVALHVHEVEKEGELYLPETSRRSGSVSTQLATVVAVGPDCKWIKEGMVVLLQPCTAYKVVHKGQLTEVVREENLFGHVIEG